MKSIRSRISDLILVVVVVIFYLSDMGEDCFILSHFTNNGVHS